MIAPWGPLALDCFLDVLRKTRCAMLHLDYIAEGRCTSEGFSGHRIRTALRDAIMALDGRLSDAQMAFLIRKTKSLLPDKPPEVRSGVNAWPYVLGVPADSLDLPPGATFSVSLVLFGEAAETWPAWVLGGREVTLGTRSLKLQHVRLEGKDGNPRTWDGNLDAGGVLTLQDLCPPEPTILAGMLGIELVTPARKRKKLPSGEWVDDDLLDEGTLRKFVRALYPRLRAVAGADPEFSAWEKLEEAAAHTRVIVNETTWAVVTHRGKQFGGRLGFFVCHGPLEPLLPFLSIGQLTHVGSETTWGLGRYRLIGAASVSAGKE